MLGLFSRETFISLEVPFSEIQPGLTSRITRNPSTGDTHCPGLTLHLTWPMLCAAHNTEQVLFILSQAVRAPDLHFLCLYSSQISSPSYVTLFTSPHSGQSPLLCCLITFLITFLWCLCFWEFRVELEECSEGCKWGMDVCTCRSLSATCYRTGNLSPAFLPFPCPFYAFAYPRKPVHCQNRTFLTLCLMFLLYLRARTANANILVQKIPKTSWVCSFVQKKTSRINTMVKMHEVHCGDCWMTVTERQKCQVLCSLESADPQKFWK